MQRLSSAKAFGGVQEVWHHASQATGTDMTFAVYTPPGEGPFRLCGICLVSRALTKM